MTERSTQDHSQEGETESIRTADAGKQAVDKPERTDKQRMREIGVHVS